MSERAQRGGRPAKPARYVILLRAVNVGGNALGLASFRDALTDAGCTSTRTVGASGSAVVDAPGVANEGKFEQEVERALRTGCGLVTDAFVRSVPEWSSVVEQNPFPEEAVDDPAHLVVTVLRAAPRSSAWTELNRSIVGRERVAPGGRHAYIVYPDGIGRSKLTAALIEAKLGVRATSRNWNTVTRLLELTRS